MNRVANAIARAGSRSLNGPRKVSNPIVVLYVGNLPWTVSRKELREHFQPFGQIRACKVAFNYETGLSRGYGFVCFQSPLAAQTALEKYPHTLDGSTLTISKSFNSNLRSFNTDFTAK